MKHQSTPPTGKPQSFEVNETFFSTTDSHGVITDGNEVFCRISGYALGDMVGQPHNLIRHPDMPRLVFRLLWDNAKAGRPFMGYVKNQARNGNHYWVFAVIVPIDGGFLSVRIKPGSPILATVEQLYQRLLAREAEAIAAGQTEAGAATAAAALVPGELKHLGFDSYDAFSHHALNAEIKHRDDEITRRGLPLFPRELPGTPGDAAGSLRGFYAQALKIYDGLNAVFTGLDAFITICNGIRDRKDAVQDIVEEFRLNALNAHIAAHPLGQQGVTLGTVALLLNNHGQSLSRNVAALAANITQTTAAVADIASNLSSARIQLEMLLSFLAEVAGGGRQAAGRRTLLTKATNLRAAFSATIDLAITALTRLQKLIPEVQGTREQLRKDIVYLQVAQISGLTEVARLPEEIGLHATFTGLRAQIETGKNELDQLGSIVEQLMALTDSTPPRVVQIRQDMHALHEPAHHEAAAPVAPSPSPSPSPSPAPASTSARSGPPRNGGHRGGDGQAHRSRELDENVRAF